MKHIVLFIILLPLFAISQKRNPTNQKEVQERLKEAQSGYDKLTPEQKKMMEQMGIKLPDAASNPVLNTKNAGTVNIAMQKEFGLVPAKDAARIGGIAATPLSDAALATYTQGVVQKISTRLSPESKSAAEKFYDQLKKEKQSALMIGNNASLIWVTGRLQIALHLMGKALAMEPGNTENLNNYAAMLILMDGGQLAIPILNKLNKNFPKNTSILNNLGQAWYQLGELNKADKYFDTVLVLSPLHVQANMSKSTIAESKGDVTKAVELVKKAAGNSLSRDIVNRLRKLKYKLTAKDIRYPTKPNSDPLGLHEFEHPPFPKNAAEEADLKEVWEAYKKDITERIISLQQQSNQLMPSPEELKKKADIGYEFAATGKITEEIKTEELPLRARAETVLNILSADKSRTLKIDAAKKGIEALLDSAKLLLKEYTKKYDKLEQEENKQIGEGLANKSFCNKFIALSEEYFAKLPNTRLEELYDNSLKQLRRNIEEELYWEQFTRSSKDFSRAVIGAKITWLSAIGQVSYTGIGLGQKQCLEVQSQSPWKLSDFDEVNCQLNSEFKTPVGSIQITCTEIITNLGVGPVNLGMKQDMRKADFFDSFKSCTVEVSAGKTYKGPLGSKVGAEVTLGMEIGRGGIQDIYVGAEVSGGFDCEVGGDKKNDIEGFKGSAKGKLTQTVHFTNDGKGNISINSSGSLGTSSGVSFNDLK
ncbi:MAG: hypothetical protein J0I32_17075 [Sphingobacteriales bacterium]|nr:hypothetical protein [Sphingobacteriales bacterium]OJV99490.1 MAG: hypothetical protein BGO52_12615 [Sphingobacteriales bacterium 44-61]